MEPMVEDAPLDPDDFFRALEVAVGLSAPRESHSRVTPAFETKLVALVKRLEKESESDLEPFVRAWRYNEEYYRGNFNVAWDKTNRRLETQPEKYPTGNKVHLNIMRPTIDMRVCRLHTMQPQIVVEPNSMDQEIVDSSKLTTRYLGDYEWQAQQMDERRLRLAHMLELLGTGCLKVWYDPRGGKYLGKSTIPKRGPDGQLQPKLTLDMEEMSPTYGQPVVSRQPDGTPEWEVEVEDDPESERFGQPIEVDVYEGKIRCEVFHPENVRSGGASTDPDDPHRWWMLLYAMSPADIFDMTSQDGKPGIVVQPDMDSTRVASLMRQMTPTQSREWVRARRDATRVRELYVPVGRWPYGDKDGEWVDVERDLGGAKLYRVVVAGDKVLHYGPYKPDLPPVIFERNAPMEGYFYGGTKADDVRGIQATLLATANHTNSILELMSSPQWIVHASAEVPKCDWTNRPGAVKRHNARADWMAPRIVEGVSPPAGLFRWMNDLKAVWLPYVGGANLGGLAGGVPPNVEAAAAFIELAERDDVQLTYSAAAIKRAVEKWAKLTALYAQLYHDEEKLITVGGGRSAAPEVFAFSGADIHESFNYIVPPESAKPQSWAAIFQSTLALKAEGLILPRDAIRRIGRQPGAGPTLSEKMAVAAKHDILEAKKFHAVLSPPELLGLADPEAYLEEYAMYLFDPASKDDPEAFNVILQRAVELKQMLALAAMPQPNADVPEGQPPAPGGPPAPGEPGTAPPIAA